jgi:hypothetical protein
VKTTNAHSITQRLRSDGINFLKIISDKKLIRAASRQMPIHNPVKVCETGLTNPDLLNTSNTAQTSESAVTIFNGVSFTFNLLSFNFFLLPVWRLVYLLFNLKNPFLLMEGAFEIWIFFPFL